jgi:hypothetical protein
MFIDNAVVKEFEGEKRYDKFSIASTIYDASFKGASCSVIESQVVNNCDECHLKYLCKEIDKVIEEFTEKTTVVTDSFSFGN